MGHMGGSVFVQSPPPPASGTIYANGLSPSNPVIPMSSAAIQSISAQNRNGLLPAPPVFEKPPADPNASAPEAPETGWDDDERRAAAALEKARADEELARRLLQEALAKKDAKAKLEKEIEESNKEAIYLSGLAAERAATAKAKSKELNEMLERERREELARHDAEAAAAKEEAEKERVYRRHQEKLKKKQNATCHSNCTIS